MKIVNDFNNVFKLLFDRDKYFESIGVPNSKLLVYRILIVCVFTFFYGCVMGSYHSFLQAISAGFKLSLLFILTIAICLPSFYIIQRVLGSKLNIIQIIDIIISGFVLVSTILLGFTPIVVFFQLTGGNYHFLQLLHVCIFAFSGVFGLQYMVQSLKTAFEKLSVYPQLGSNVFKIWIVILAFVSIQLSWNLRPFLCQKNEEYMLFRNYEGNFYTAIIYSIEQLSEDEPKQSFYKYDNYDQTDTSVYVKDSIQ